MKDIEIINKYKSGTNIYQLVKETGLKYGKIARMLKKNNVEKFDGRKPQFSHKDITYIISEYNKGIPFTVISNQFKCASRQIKQILIENNIPLRSLSDQRKLQDYKKFVGDTLPIGEITDYYLKQNYSLYKLGKLYNCSPGTIRDLLNKHNIKTTSDCNSKKYKKKKRQDILDILPIKEICKLYKTTSFTNICKQYNISSNILNTILEKNNINKRDLSEIYKLQRAHGFHKPYTLPSGKVIQLMGYEPRFLDFIFSNNLLTEDEIDYDPKPISYIKDNITHMYIPDFYIPKCNLVIEIKSKYILEKQGDQLEKEQGVRNSGYNYCLILDNNFNHVKILLKNQKLKIKNK